MLYILKKMKKRFKKFVKRFLHAHIIGRVERESCFTFFLIYDILKIFR